MLFGSTLIYAGVGLFFLSFYEETLLVSKMYEPALNFLVVTSVLQIAIYLLSCFYLYKKYLVKIDQPISMIENYLNDLTKKKRPNQKLKVDNTFSNIKQVSLLIKVLVSYWQMEYRKKASRSSGRSSGKKKTKKAA